MTRWWPLRVRVQRTPPFNSSLSVIKTNGLQERILSSEFFSFFLHNFPLTMFFQTETRMMKIILVLIKKFLEAIFAEIIHLKTK